MAANGFSTEAVTEDWLTDTRAAVTTNIKGNMGTDKGLDIQEEHGLQLSAGKDVKGEYVNKESGVEVSGKVFLPKLSVAQGSHALINEHGVSLRNDWFQQASTGAQGTSTRAAPGRRGGIPAETW